MRRLLLCSLGALALAVCPINASAAAPVILHYTLIPGILPITGVCSFDFTVAPVLDITEIDYFDSTGANTRVYLHGTEVDTFVGPGATLISDPYTSNIEVKFQGDNIVTFFSSGEVLKVRLPNGLFLSAGRTNVALVNGSFSFAPTFGHAGNLQAFCAALAG